MEKIKFAHFRTYDMQYNIGNLGGITVAYQKIEEGKFRVAYAHCHPKDNFCKATGRIKAAGRLKSNDQSQVVEYSSEKEFLMDERTIQYPYKLVTDIRGK